MNKDINLEITIKVTENKGIIIGRSVILFKKPRYVAGIWGGNSIVFACHEPKTLNDTEVLIYTINEIKKFAENGNIEGLVDIE